MNKNLKPFFEPAGVAVIGASANPTKLSHGIFKNLNRYGYPGGKYPVNPGANEILGQKCYAGILDVPNPVDLAVIILPAPAIPEVLKDCGKRNIPAAIIISGGFREIGSQGLQLEEECLQIAEKNNIRLIGPNCVGNINLITGLNTTFIQGMPVRGGIGFLSQSGAVCGGIVDHVVNKQIGFSHFVSLGNEADVNETDVIEYLASDDATRVITAYVESIRNGRRFIDICKKVSRIKPIVILKAGRSEAGGKAVSSHTGSMAGSRAAYSAAFKQAGVIEVFSVEELLNVSQALDFSPLPKGRKTAILTNAGGPAALAADSLDENGFQLARLNEQSMSNLKPQLAAAAQVGNPIDMLGGADPKQYQAALHEVLFDAGVDLAIPILVPQALVNPAQVAQAIADETLKSKKPVIACFMGEQSIVEARQILHENRITMLDYPEKIGSVCAGLWRYAEIKLHKNIDKTVQLTNLDPKGVAHFFDAHIGEKVFGEMESRLIFEKYGLPIVAGQLAKNKEEALDLAEKFGYPLVLKIAAKGIMHKSDVQGVVVGIKNDTELTFAWDEIMKKAKLANASSVIQGCMVEKMAKPGWEVILGMKRDPNFGALMMFGLGGIFVELYRDVSFRVAPLSRSGAKEMVAETKAAALLKGFRGKLEADLEGIYDCLQRLSQLAMDFPSICEMEINPLVVYPKSEGVLGLDCRILLEE